YSVNYPNLLPIEKWLSNRLHLVKKLGASFSPKYFTLVIMLAYQAVKFQALSFQKSTLINREASKTRVSSLQSFTRSLALTSFQMQGRVNSTGLYPVQYPSKTPNTIATRTPSIAAGLPHFSTSYMRCWGRDIFISLRGLYLIPGHYDVAREHIIAFGSTLRHGLIPNLLDQGYKSRYNARDATWFWFLAVQEYCQEAPEGLEFLKSKVKRRFPPLTRYHPETFMKVQDESENDTFVEIDDTRCYLVESTIAMLCQEILDRHARGINFREWNAGSALDHAMRSEGFEINVGIKWENGRGFVYGGNRFNCGTWMDKMGDSEKAGIRGLPATPRDGSAIELVALVKSALRWITNDVDGKIKDTWPWKGVELKDKSDDHKYFIPKPELVNRRGIYKDSVSATLEYQDYQLRPNLFIAMVVAPELFNVNHAVETLRIAKEVLVSPLGIKTLDPSDWAYRGVYDNANDSDDPTVAKGINYHNGPEWVWVYSYYLRAYLHFERIAAHSESSKQKFNVALANVSKLISYHKYHILDTSASPFAGLPELTNSNGTFCRDSCDTQTWSSATMLELVNDIGQNSL
ncbi:hypothetical protein HK096_006327, partial [Nowakowskiella sp. JEL0078]